MNLESRFSELPARMTREQKIGQPSQELSLTP